MIIVIKTIYMIQEFQEVCKNLNREQVGKISLFCLCTKGAYYVPYSFLFISNKFCNGGKRPEPGD